VRGRAPDWKTERLKLHRHLRATQQGMENLLPWPSAVAQACRLRELVHCRSALHVIHNLRLRVDSVRHVVRQLDVFRVQRLHRIGREVEELACLLAGVLELHAVNNQQSAVRHEPSAFSSQPIASSK
jgi:hypothetical protein